MNIEFDNAALEELYTTGTTKDSQYKKLSKDIVKRFKKKGDLNGVDAVWINDQYRLFFYSSPDESGIIVNALIFEISKHYE